MANPTIAAHGDDVQVLLTGAIETRRKLRLLPAKVERRVARQAAIKASTPMIKQIRENLPRKSRRKGARHPLGIYRRSIGRKTTQYQGRGIVLVVVGPRGGFQQQIGTTRDGRPIYEDPARIAHLVEFGHGGPHRAEGKAQVRRAYEAKKHECRRVFEIALRDGVEREAAKLVASG